MVLTKLILDRIIKDFYLAQADLDKRPRIFGMTASPVDVDAREDIGTKAMYDRTCSTMSGS